MALPVLNKTGLPVDVSKIKAKEALLKPLPIKEMMNYYLRIVDEDGFERESPMSMGDFFYTLKPLVAKINDNLNFGDWKYDLYIMIEHEDPNIMTFELTARKMNCKMRLSINKIWIDRFDLQDEAEGQLAKDEWGMIVPQSKIYVKWVFGFLKKCNENIKQWNNICVKSNPIINSKPPFDDVGRLIWESFKEDVVYEEYERMEMDYGCIDYDKFLTEQRYEIGEIIHYSLKEEFPYWNFGKKPTFTWEFECRTLPMERGYLDLIESYISVEGLNLRFFVFEEEYYSWEDEYTYDETKEWIKGMLDDIKDTIIQWNKIIS